MIHDINERNNIEEALRKSELMFRNIFDNNPLGIFLLVNRVFIKVNSALCRITGYRAEELVGQSVRIGYKNDEEYVRAGTSLYQQVMKNGLGMAEARLRRKNGEEFDGLLYLSPIDPQDDSSGYQGMMIDITERKQTEDKLRHSEEEYRTILDNIEEGYYEVDLKGHLTMFNHSMYKILGYSKEELMGLHYRRFVDEENAKTVFQTFNRVFRTGEPAKEFNWQIIGKDGTKRYIEVSVSLRKNSAGEPLGFRGIFRDITERKQTEQKLNAEKQRFQTLADQSSDIILLVDNTGRITYENKAIGNILGYDPEERIGKSSLDNIHPDDLQCQMVEFKKIFTDVHAPPFRTEVRVRHKNGNWRIFEEIASGLSRKNIVESVIVNLRDITERKQAEEALKKSEAKYRNIFENAMEGIFQATQEGQFITVNKAFARMAGYESPEDLIESIKDMGTQFFVIDQDRDRFLKIKEAQGFVEDFETEFYKKHGGTFWVIINARLVRDNEGKVLFTEGLIEDITPRKQAEQQLHVSMERLKKAVGTTIQVLVSTLEIRDPYTSGHQTRTANLACAIAKELGLPPGKIEGLRMAGIIHDIGKLAVPAEILSKPTKLTEIEFSLIQEHPHCGYEMLKDVESPWPLAEIVHQHHERMNGQGYPRNLKGDEILMEARILCVADVVEAMASHRPYRASLGIEAALQEIMQNKGKAYDDAVVDACVKLFKEKGYHLDLEF